MMGKRLDRINELLRREIAEALFREITETGFNPATVTVTRVAVAPNLRHARVSVSVMGDEARCQAVLRLLRRHRVHLQQFINRDLVLKYTPVLHFESDASIAEGDRILRLMEQLPPAAAEEDDETERTDEGDGA